MDAEELWWEFLSNDNLCGLCGQTGIIDTRGRVRSPAGVECGVRRYCICPNGRTLREQAEGRRWPADHCDRSGPPIPAWAKIL